MQDNRPVEDRRNRQSGDNDECPFPGEQSGDAAGDRSRSAARDLAASNGVRGQVPPCTILAFPSLGTVENETMADVRQLRRADATGLAPDGATGSRRLATIG